jgi:large subunit ribosomal protein L33
MAKAVTIKVKLVSSADTGYYYVAKKNSRTMTDKLVKKKYDPVARKHVEFRGRRPGRPRSPGSHERTPRRTECRRLLGRLRA